MSPETIINNIEKCRANRSVMDSNIEEFRKRWSSYDKGKIGEAKVIPALALAIYDFEDVVLARELLKIWLNKNTSADCLVLAKLYEINERIRTAISGDWWKRMELSEPQKAKELKANIKIINTVTQGIGLTPEERNIAVHGSLDFEELCKLRDSVKAKDVDNIVKMAKMPMINMLAILMQIGLTSQ